MNRIVRAAPVILTAHLFSILLARSGAISVPNYSFELPATGFVSINVDSWQKAPQPSDYQSYNGFDWTQLAGIFKNTTTGSSDHIDNCDGNQALWLFAVPGVGLFQDYDSTDYHNLPPNHQFSATYQPGRTYQLSVGLIGGGGGMLSDATLELMLYYRDDASNQVPVAMTIVTNDAAVFTTTTHFLDFQVSVPAVQATDSWAGRHIGIQLQSTVNTNAQGGYWDIDNIRLIEQYADQYVSPVPDVGNSGFSNGVFQFTVFSQPGTALEILSATNPATPSSNWLSAGFLTNSTDRSMFSVPATTGPPRFFRVRKLQQ